VDKILSLKPAKTITNGVKSMVIEDENVVVVGKL